MHASALSAACVSATIANPDRYRGRLSRRQGMLCLEHRPPHGLHHDDTQANEGDDVDGRDNHAYGRRAARINSVGGDKTGEVNQGMDDHQRPKHARSQGHGSKTKPDRQRIPHLQ